MAWADELLACVSEADLTVKVPADFPAYSAALYATLGVAVEVDASLPAFKRGGLSEGLKRR